MTEGFVLFLGQETLKTTAMVAAPMLLAALVTGLIISFFQAITQINEATLSFIPKMIIIGIVMLVAGSWMMDILIVFSKGLFENLPEWVNQ